MLVFQYLTLHIFNLYRLLPCLLFHYSMMHYVNLTLFYVALLMLHYMLNAPPFIVVLYQYSTVLYCINNVGLF